LKIIIRENVERKNNLKIRCRRDKNVRTTVSLRMTFCFAQSREIILLKTEREGAIQTRIITNMGKLGANIG
jgi:hypothetical protein